MGLRMRPKRTRHVNGQRVKSRSGAGIQKKGVIKAQKEALAHHRGLVQQKLLAKQVDVPMYDQDGELLDKARRNFLKIKAMADAAKAAKVKGKLAGALSKKARVRA